MSCVTNWARKVFVERFVYRIFQHCTGLAKEKKRTGSHIKETKVRMYQIHPIGNLLKLTKLLPWHVDEVIGCYKTILTTFVGFPSKKWYPKAKQLFFLVPAVVVISAIAVFTRGLGLVHSRSTPRTAKVKEQLCGMLVICKVNCTGGSDYTWQIKI